MIVSSTLTTCTLCPYSLMARMADSQSADRGSTPRRDIVSEAEVVEVLDCESGVSGFESRRSP